MGRQVPKLSENIENRVNKLTKPANAAQALQPLFEAVSNAAFGIEDRLGIENVSKGKVAIVVEFLTDPNKIQISVSDDGIGLDASRYSAFCELDTDFKKVRGGKGVGRLFWLDAFQKISVVSKFQAGDAFVGRQFNFVLSNDEQIIMVDPPTIELGGTGTKVDFQGLRVGDYAAQFPKRRDTFLRYFSAHFLSDFLIGNGPSITVDLDGEATQYPEEIKRLVVEGPLETGAFEHPDFGNLSLKGFICLPEASTGLDGNHQLHLLANGRTVQSRKIDNLIALTSLRRKDHTDLVFHGCVSGDYLDRHVNEGRTAFNITEKILKEISRHCVDIVKSKLLFKDIQEYTEKRRVSYEDFVERHPIYGFDDDETQLERVPFHATDPEDFAAGLVKYQIRREEERQNAMQKVISCIASGEAVPPNFAETVVAAAKDIHVSEQLALAQHVVRRKLVLELFDKLLTRFRERDGKDDDHQLEATLHSFICPMRIRGDDASSPKARAHDLWLIDERLAFTRAFSSDERLDRILSEGGTGERPDLILWDLSFGMGVSEPSETGTEVDITEPLRKMMVVEFKKPMRRDYAKAEDQLEAQIIKYLAKLKGNDLESFGRERIRIAPDCIFYCYVIADIVGDLEQQLSNWERTANGQGRIRPLKNEYRGVIEVVQWKDLVNDAWARNQALLFSAGLSRSKAILPTAASAVGGEIA